MPIKVIGIIKILLLLNSIYNVPLSIPIWSNKINNLKINFVPGYIEYGKYDFIEWFLYLI